MKKNPNQGKNTKVENKTVAPESKPLTPEEKAIREEALNNLKEKSDAFKNDKLTEDGKLLQEQTPKVEEVPKEEDKPIDTPKEEDKPIDTPKDEGKVEDTPKDEGKVEDTPKDEGKVEDVPKEEGKVEDVPKEEGKGEDVPKEEGTDNKEDDKKNKPGKKLEPKAWQRISDDGKYLQDQIVFLGEKVDYSPGFKHKYKYSNLDAKDGLTRVVTAKYPKDSDPEKVENIEYKGFKITLTKFGSSAVCRVEDKEGKEILNYVSLATVLDVLQDLINSGNTCDVTWGTIDQAIKFKRGLKSRIKNLDANDNTVRNNRNDKVTPEDVKAIDDEAKKYAEQTGQKAPGYTNELGKEGEGADKQQAPEPEQVPNEADKKDELPKQEGTIENKEVIGA